MQIQYILYYVLSSDPYTTQPGPLPAKLVQVGLVGFLSTYKTPAAGTRGSSMLNMIRFDARRHDWKLKILKSQFCGNIAHGHHHPDAVCTVNRSFVVCGIRSAFGA